MKKTITVFSLASDDDGGTSARVFATEKEAVAALLDALALDHNSRHRLMQEYSDPEGDFYGRLDDYKSAYDTYSIDQHTLEVEV
jgi:hypothetical protein